MHAATPLPTRSIGSFPVSAIGLGCMNLSHAYGAPPPPGQAEALLLRALDLGITLFDSAALYGFGANEELVGRVLEPHRSRIKLASKCGMTGVQGKRVIDGRPETLRRSSSFVAQCSLAYSALACLRIGMSGSASFQRVRKSW